MTKTLAIHSHSILTVQRPHGAVETVTHPAKFDAVLFARAKCETAKAGRGELLSYVNHSKTVDAPKPAAADIVRDAYYANTAAIYRASAG